MGVEEDDRKAGRRVSAAQRHQTEERRQHCSFVET